MARLPSEFDHAPPHVPGEQHLGYLEVSPELFCRALGLPEGTVIMRVAESDRHGELRLVVSHPTLPRTMPGCTIMRLDPQFGPCDSRGRAEFLGWFRKPEDTAPPFANLQARSAAEARVAAAVEDYKLKPEDAYRLASAIDELGRISGGRHKAPSVLAATKEWVGEATEVREEPVPEPTIVQRSAMANLSADLDKRLGS